MLEPTDIGLLGSLPHFECRLLQQCRRVQRADADRPRALPFSWKHPFYAYLQWIAPPKSNNPSMQVSDLRQLIRGRRGPAPRPDGTVEGNAHCRASAWPALASRRRSGRATSWLVTGRTRGSPVFVSSTRRVRRSRSIRSQCSPMTSPRRLPEVLLLRSGAPSGASRTPLGGSEHPGWRPGLDARGEVDEPFVPTSGRHGADWVTTCAARSAARAG